MAFLANFRKRLHRLRGETYALYLAARHPQTPWYAKLLIAIVVAYAFSPIDLIPDFIPILGYLDDLILIPLGVAAALRLVPPHVLVECRERAGSAQSAARPVSRIAAVVIVALWLVLAAACVVWMYQALINGTDP